MVLHRHLLVGLLAIIVPVTSAQALVPMAEDEVIYDGPARFIGDTWTHDFVLISSRPAGFYLAAAGVERFQVFLNESLLATSEPGPTPRTLLRAMDLSAWTGLLRAGRNRLKLVATEPADSFRVRCWASPKAWYLGSSHNHTLYSDGVLTVHELMEWADRDGAWFLGVTDHNTLDQCADSSFRRFGRCEPMRGTEWTADSGHANLMGIRGQEPVPISGPVRWMIDEAKYRGALVHVNHPFSPDHLWRRAPVLDPGIDGIELMNGRTGLAENEALAVEWWHSLLVAGRAIAGIGSSDFHGDNKWEEPLAPCARVRASSNHPDTLLRAFKLGRVMACLRHDGSRLYLYADTSGDGRWDLGMGDHAVVGAGSPPIRFRVEVESVLPNQELTVLDRGGVVLRVGFTEAGDFSHEWTSVHNPADLGFVRAELRRPNGRFAALTNPVYVNYPGYELGPTELVPQAALRHLPGRIAPDSPVSYPALFRLDVKLENRDGYSPYEYGIAVAVDTAGWEVRSSQLKGPGIGVARDFRVEGYRVLTWRGGYEWGNRLRPGETVAFGAELQVKRGDARPVLYRCWANDRLFDFAADPDSGVTGPDGRQWHELAAGYELVQADADRPAARSAEGLEVTGLTVAAGRVQLAFDLSGPDPVPLDLQLYDMVGRCRMARRIAVSPGPDRSTEFDLVDSAGRRLPAGVYFLRLSTGRRGAGGGLPGLVVVRRLVVS